jgi:HPt (histidine-containing phosphotransfer) domain-containing protein
MALHYNLAKVYSRFNSDEDKVFVEIDLFIDQMPTQIEMLYLGIDDKDYDLVKATAQKMRDKLDLFGMNVAFEEINLVEEWAQKQGKRKEIKGVYQSLNKQIKNTIKELKKDF